MTTNALVNSETLAAFLPFGTGNVANLYGQISYTNTTYTNRNAVIQLRRDTPAPAGVQAALNIIVSGLGDNTTFKGVSGAFIQAGDSAGVVSGTKGILYGLQLGAAPLVARNNIGIDDADCLILQHTGSVAGANGTDCLYIGHNSLFTSDTREWVTGTTNAANCGYVQRATGAYFTGYDFSGRLTDASTNAYGVYVHPTIQSTITGNAYLFRTELNTAASAFTLTTLHHFSAQQVSIGAGSAVTVQIGFNAASGLTGATTNYGFQSNLSLSGTARWNFYAAGTAPNLFAGSTIIGLGTVANAATDGFLYLPSTTSAAPTGVPTAFAGRCAVVVDSTNSKLWINFGGTWKSVTLT